MTEREEREFTLMCDAALRPQELDDKYNPVGGEEYPYFTRQDWRDEVDHEYTLAGYWEWVSQMILEELNED